MNEGLRGQFFELSTRRLKRHLQMMSSDGSKATLGKEMNHRHLQRIKRNLSRNPCYEQDSFKSITLSDNSKTFSVECKKSTTTGCFHNVGTFTTTLCTENITFFLSARQSVVQGCSCA